MSRRAGSAIVGQVVEEYDDDDEIGVQIAKTERQGLLPMRRWANFSSGPKPAGLSAV